MSKEYRYFYCLKTLDGRSGQAGIFRCIFAQLSSAKYYTVIVPNIQTEFEKRKGRRSLISKPSMIEVKKYFEELLRANQSTTTIVIDGLDECSNFNKLLLYLKALFFEEETGIFTLKMVLSSRMLVYPPHNFPSQKEVIVLPDRNSKDIEEYIHSQIFDRENHKHGERLLNGDDQGRELEQELFKVLTGRAQGCELLQH